MWPQVFAKFIFVTIPFLLFLAAAFPLSAQQFELQTAQKGEPVVDADGTQTFTLRPGFCSYKTYQSKRLLGEASDCSRKRTRVEFRELDAASEGDMKIYSWEILIPKNFSYSATGGHLIAGQFHTGSDLLFSFALGNDGYTVRSKQCVTPTEFGKWNTIVVRYKFDATKKKSFKDKTPGVLTVECNGVEVVNASGRPNLSKGSKVYFKYGLYGALNFPENDIVSVKYRNVRIEEW